MTLSLSKLVFHSRLLSIHLFSRLSISVIENFRRFAVYSLLAEQEIVKDKGKPLRKALHLNLVTSIGLATRNAFDHNETSKISCFQLDLN